MDNKKSKLQHIDFIKKMNDHLPMLRAQAGIQQAEIASIVGIARTTYSAIENKKRKMTLNVFISLSKYFSENEKTKDIMNLIGLSEDVLEPFFCLNTIIETNTKTSEVKKVAAFGGNINEESNK